MTNGRMLQSKRIISSALLAIILVGGAWFLSRAQTSKTGNVGETKKADLAALEKDTDGDGLKDWEERLWKSDVNNKDTDGDGTTDGDEVKEERNPLVAGPDDSLKTLALSENIVAKQSAEDESLNFSESFSRFVFSSYVDSKLNKSLTPETASLDALLSTKLPPVKVYEITDLGPRVSNETSSYKSYGNIFSEILIQNANSSSGSELTILATAFANDDKKELLKLDPVVRNMEASISSLLKMQIPAEIAEKHLDFINVLSATKYDIEMMKSAYDDPMVAFLAVNSYKGDSERLTRSLENLKDMVKLSGVVFAESEAGYKIFK